SVITFFPTPAIIVQIGPIALHTYGAMYALGAICGYFLLQFLARRKKLNIRNELLLDLVFWTFLGGVIGGRIFYVLVYNFSYFLHSPSEIFAVWHGGMSIHGGLLGGALAAIIFIRRKKLPLWSIAGIIAPAVALGMMFGRIGNFANGELFGRPTLLPWGMDFGDGIKRHPAQLYAAAKDLILFCAFLGLNLKTQISGKALWSYFLIGYGVLRFGVEFFREPDPQIGLFWGVLSLGQILSIAVIFVGIIILRTKKTRQKA